MMKVRYYILIVLSICSFILSETISAQDTVTVDSISSTIDNIDEKDTSLIESSADIAYRNNDFEESIELYKEEIKNEKLQHRESAHLYYNLGNAYFRNNQIAKAIVNYERALLLDPGDSDIRHNLRFTRTHIEDKIDNSEAFIINQWMRNFQNLFSANTWATIAIVLFILLIVLAGIYMISVRLLIRKLAFYSGIALLSLTIIANVFAFRQKNKIINRTTGIVMSASVSIFTSPDIHSQELFRLHEGAKVKIKREENSWFEITIANGSVGWLRKKDIEII